MSVFAIGRLAGTGGPALTFPVLSQAGPPPVTAQERHTYFLDAYGALWEAQGDDTYVQRSEGMGPTLPEDAGEGYVFLRTDGLLYVRGADDWVLMEATGPQGEQGEPGTPGAAGAAGSRILTGTAAPTTEGNLGDCYVQKDTGVLNWYGPKDANGWGDPTSMLPPA